MSTGIPVTVDNFCRAETDNYFASVGSAQGRFGQFGHARTGMDLAHQYVIRMNRDTWYSSGVFDFTAPLTVHVPDAGERFLSLLVINEDHYVKLIAHEPGDYPLTQDLVGTRYAAVIVRILVDPDDPADVAQVHALQDQLSITQSDPGRLELPEWDSGTLDACRSALLALGKFIPPGPGRFGDVDEVDPIRHLVSTASGWGGNPPSAAMYTGAYPERADGITPHVLRLRDVPVDGFWSLSVYNADGYFEPNEHDAYSLNNITGTPDPDGGYTIHFGGDPTQSNFLAIMPGWNYVLRLYRPRPEVLDGTWQAPQAEPVDA